MSQTLAGVGALRRDTLVSDELKPERCLVSLSLGPVRFRALLRRAVRVGVHPFTVQETVASRRGFTRSLPTLRAAPPVLALRPCSASHTPTARRFAVIRPPRCT